MAENPAPTHLRGETLNRSWRIVTFAGAFGALYFSCCVGGVARVKFLTEMGATAWHFGVITALGSVAVAFQMVSGVMANHLRRRKTAWIALCVAHRALFVPVLLAPALFIDPRLRMLWIIGALFLHDALMHMAGPIWFSWMSDLLPPRAANRYWGKRQRTVTTLSICFSIGIYLYLRRIEAAEDIVPGLIVLGLVGVVMGIFDVLLFTAVPEPSHERAPGAGLFQSLTQPLRDAEFRPFLLFTCYWQLAGAFAFPFFAPYMVEVLDLPASTVQLVLTSSALGIAFSSRIWGLLCDTYGKRPVLQLAVCFKTFIVIVFLLIPPIPVVAIPVLSVAFFFDGILNSGFMLSSLGLRMQATPRKNRTMYIAASTFFAVGIAGAFSSYMGGQCAEWSKHVSLRVGPFHIVNYHVPFAISLALRLGAIIVVRRVRENRGMPVHTMLAHLRAANPIRVSTLVYRLLESRSEAQRAQAARRLGQLGSPMAIGGLIGALSDNNKTVRRAAANALGRIGSVDATYALAQVLEDRARGIQSAAARALGRISDEESVKALLENLRALDHKALEQAVDSLRQLGDSAAILPLVMLLEEVQDNERLARKITRALATLSTTQSAGEVLSMFRTERERRARV